MTYKTIKLVFHQTSLQDHMVNINFEVSGIFRNLWKVLCTISDNVNFREYSMSNLKRQNLVSFKFFETVRLAGVVGTAGTLMVVSCNGAGFPSQISLRASPRLVPPGHAPPGHRPPSAVIGSHWLITVTGWACGLCHCGRPASRALPPALSCPASP